MTTPEVVFAKLMSIDGIGRVSNEKAFARIGSLIDLSADLARDDGTTRASEVAQRRRLEMGLANVDKAKTDCLVQLG